MKTKTKVTVRSRIARKSAGVKPAAASPATEIHIHPEKVEVHMNGELCGRLPNGAPGSAASFDRQRLIRSNPGAKVRNFNAQGVEIL